MSLLYKKSKDLTYSVEVRERKDVDSLDMNFYVDCGKHGICEILDSYEITQKHDKSHVFVFAKPK